MVTRTRIAAAVRDVSARLLEPIDPASLVFFRIAFGVVMAVEIWRYFEHGWIARYYVDHQFHFKYFGFGWVHALPGNGMYFVFAALGVLALCIIAGFRYRAAITLFFFGFTYVFLLDQTRYLNHFYLISLISFLLIFVSAHRAFSVDARLNPDIRSRPVRAWALWILRAQFTIMYVYGGIAKIDADWMRGAPMRGMLARNTSLPWVGEHLTEERVVLAFAWGGLLFDLLIVALLLWPLTRYLALAWAAAFHGMNHALFDIGVFPFFAMAGTLLFLPPDWPRRLISRFVPAKSEVPAAAPPRQKKSKSRNKQRPQSRRPKIATYSKPAAALLTAFFVVQILFPLRHFLYPGDANWTGEGQHFAWRMMLREHYGNGRFVATDRASGRQIAIYPRRHLDREQVEVMWTDPDMILQFAHYMAGQLRREGWRSVEIHATTHKSLNGRRSQSLVDPDVNLAAERRSLRPAKWIVPLTEPLPDRDGRRLTSRRER